MEAPERAATGGNLAWPRSTPRLLANAIRFLSIDAIERVGEGHPGTPLGAADTTTALFTRHLKFNPKDPLWFDRDRFVESNGHGSMLLYALLYLSGYEKITLDDIKRVPGTRLALRGASGVRPDLRHRDRRRARSARASPTPPAWRSPRLF